MSKLQRHVVMVLMLAGFGFVAGRAWPASLAAVEWSDTWPSADRSPLTLGF
jgi:hypothetical protein